MQRGYAVKIIPPQFVKPFIKSNKNDANDAAAICEAMGRPDMHPVKVKMVEQQDLQAMHRIRDEIKSHRIAKANQIRGLVTEYGLVAPQQLPALRRAIPDWLEEAENGLSFLFRQLLQGLWGDLYALDQRMTELDKQIAVIAQEDPRLTNRRAPYELEPSHSFPTSSLEVERLVSAILQGPGCHSRIAATLQGLLTK